MSSDLRSTLEEALAEADNEFVIRCQERMEKGQAKYGELKFLEVDTVEEAMQEALDLANYARFIYIKLYLLRKATAKLATQHPAANHEGFVPLKSLLGDAQ